MTAGRDDRHWLVGIVVIGRNERERLERCLTSVQGQALELVYVDSGSTDGSQEFARSLGVQVVELDPSLPFTAARGRNVGFAHLIARRPELEFVQFLDGDCTLDGEWMPQALAFLANNPDAAIVCGRRREMKPEASVYNRLCDAEWDTAVGEAESCGGDFLARVSAFQEVGGFSADMIAGEEPDLCWRLRQRSWKVHRIGAEMTLHDAAMTRFSQWWLRNKRSGHAMAEAVRRRGGWRNPSTVRSVVSNVVWAAPPFWLLWPLLWWRIYRKRRDPTQAAFTVLGKLPHLHGQLSYWGARRRTGGRRLIEYK